MNNILSSLKLIVLTLLICCIAYPLGILAVAQTLKPQSANGSLILDSQGRIIGSSLIAQAFNAPQYFWPRPSAVDYAANAAGGSNLSPSSPLFAERTATLLTKYATSPERLIPADLVTASGAGLDPHISESAALYQAPRIAQQRQRNITQITDLITSMSFAPGGRLAPARIINVLEVNIKLDQLP